MRLFSLFFLLLLFPFTIFAATVNVSQTISDGTLNLRITSDACVTDVSSPSLSFSTTAFSFSSQTSTATIAPSGARLCIENPTGTPTWSVTIAPSGGVTATWSNGSASFDFNDSSNASDGADADSVGGRLWWSAGGTVSGLGSCATTGITIGSAAAFSEGVIDALTLLSAGGSAATYCRFTYTATTTNMLQTIPSSQPGGTPYTVNMVITVS